MATSDVNASKQPLDVTWDDVRKAHRPGREVLRVVIRVVVVTLLLFLVLIYSLHQAFVREQQKKEPVVLKVSVAKPDLGHAKVSPKTTALLKRKILCEKIKHWTQKSALQMGPVSKITCGVLPFHVD